MSLSVVEVCDRCRGAFVVSEGRCISCGGTGAHYPVSGEPPDWLWLMPSAVPLVVGVRVRHYTLRHVGYIHSTRADGSFDVLWARPIPVIFGAEPEEIRIDLEDPSGSGYGYALRHAWKEIGRLPGYASAAALGRLSIDYLFGASPSDGDRRLLAGYLDHMTRTARAYRPVEE